MSAVGQPGVSVLSGFMFECYSFDAITDACFRRVTTFVHTFIVVADNEEADQLDKPAILSPSQFSVAQPQGISSKLNHLSETMFDCYSFDAITGTLLLLIAGYQTVWLL